MNYQKTDNPELEREQDISIKEIDLAANEALITYNENLFNLNPAYLELKPIRKVLLRVFVLPAKVDDNGIIIPNTLYVKKLTDSGFGYAGEIENIFPYSKKAVVVAVPEVLKSSLNVGEVVFLSDDQVNAVTAGSGNNAEIIIKNAFVRPDVYLKRQIPTEPTNEHYGYVLVDYADIQFKL
jgi:hypothetical protein